MRIAFNKTNNYTAYPYVNLYIGIRRQAAIDYISAKKYITKHKEDKQKSSKYVESEIAVYECKKWIGESIARQIDKEFKL